MKKFYKTVLLLSVLIILTTYSPRHIDIFLKEKKSLFEVKNIEILNDYIIDKNEIIGKLSNIYGKNIFFLQKNDLEESLKSIDFLDKIEVKKKYPDTLIIKIYETRSIAILFKENKKYLIDSSSKLIVLDDKIIVDDFPHVFGKGAEHKFINFYKLLEENNFPKDRIKNYYYFQIDRWDLKLLNNQLIKLSPNKTVEAIKQSVELLNRKDFENYNIIDLRIHGKIVVE